MENKLIYKQMSLVMKDVEAIKKDRQNEIQGYKFRWIDDCYNMLHDIMVKHEVICIPKVISITKEENVNAKGTKLFYFYNQVEYTFYASDWSSITSVVPWEAMDSWDKASNKAMSSAHKVLLLQTFMIPTEWDNDTENTTHEVVEKPEITIEQLEKQFEKVQAKVDAKEDYPTKPKFTATISDYYKLNEKAFEAIDKFYSTILF